MIDDTLRNQSANRKKQTRILLQNYVENGTLPPFGSTPCPEQITEQLAPQVNFVYNYYFSTSALLYIAVSHQHLLFFRGSIHKLCSIKFFFF